VSTAAGTTAARQGSERSTTAPGSDLLGVVVVNYASAALLRENLGAVGPLGPAVRVVVVDNASTAEERTAVQNLTAELGWTLVGLPDNRGFGAATNAGIAAARELGCVTFCCLNPDARTTPEVLTALRAASLADPLAVLSPRIVDSAGRTVFAGSRLSLVDGRIRSPQSAGGLGTGPVAEWLTGACLVLHQEMVDRLGGFPDDYFLYWEDVELSYRVVAAGGHLVVREDLVALHDEGGTQGHRRTGPAKSDLYYRYNCRNRLVFAARNLPRRRMLRWLVATPAVSWEILLRGGRRQLVHSPRPLLAAIVGSLAGTSVLLRALIAPSGRRRSVLVAHPGAELYGSDRVLLDSVAALARECPVVVVLPGEGPLAEELRTRGIPVRLCRMPVLRHSALRPAGAFRLLSDGIRGFVPGLLLVLRHGRGGVYVNTLTVPSWVVLGRLLGRRVVCHVHEAERAMPRVMRTSLALPLFLAHRVVANSRTSADTLVEVLPRLRSRIGVVTNAIAAPPAPVPPRTGPVDAVRLLFVGRLSPRKGPQMALAVLRALRQRGVDARLDLLGSTFAGYEWFEQELRVTVAADGLGDVVRFLGFCPDIWPVMAEADVVLVPSQADESFGNTAVEAVLAARPVVVSAISGLLEATDGFWSVQAVDATDAEAWVAAVARVVAEWPEFRSRAMADADEARRRHAVDRYREELAAVVLPQKGEVPAGSPDAPSGNPRPPVVR
jgi:GT2 family glycosyltransferase